MKVFSIHIPTICLLMSVSVSLIAQNSSVEKSDPKATKLLNSVKKECDRQKSIEIAFTLDLEIPNHKNEIQKGKLIQEGNKYVVELADQEIYSDGKDVWVYLKDHNEVQINNAENAESTGFLSPMDIAKLYESGDFFYAITGEVVEQGVNVTHIEFKPLKKKSDYAKLRLSVNPKTNRPTSMKVFSKDGSRYTIKITNFQTNKTYGPETFVFSSTNHKGVKIEDLRID